MPPWSKKLRHYDHEHLGIRCVKLHLVNLNRVEGKRNFPLLFCISIQVKRIVCGATGPGARNTATEQDLNISSGHNWS